MSTNWTDGTSPNNIIDFAKKRNVVVKNDQTPDIIDASDEINLTIYADGASKTVNLPPINIPVGYQAIISVKKERIAMASAFEGQRPTQPSYRLMDARSSDIHSTADKNTQVTPSLDFTKYDKMKSSYGEVNSNFSEIHQAINEIVSTVRETSSGNGGGGMDNLEKRVENLEKKVEALDGRLVNVEKDIILIKEQTKKLESMPTTSEIEQLISRTISDAMKNIPNEDRMKNIIREEIKELPDKYQVKDIIRGVIDDKKLASESHVTLVVKSEIETAKTSALKVGIPILIALVTASVALGNLIINYFKTQ